MDSQWYSDVVNDWQFQFSVNSILLCLGIVIFYVWLGVIIQFILIYAALFLSYEGSNSIKYQEKKDFTDCVCFVSNLCRSPITEVPFFSVR